MPLPGSAAADGDRQESEVALTFLRAARAGNWEKISEILDKININYQNSNGLCALHVAAKEGHLATVVRLIEHGADINLATKRGNTPLHVAALAGRSEVVQAIVQHGASVNAQTEAGFTAIYMAAQENHEDIVRYLLEQGADHQKKTKDGHTPLAVALQEGSDGAVCALLEFGQTGRVRLPALHIAAKKDDVDAAALLLRTQSVATESPGGFTPLHIAAHYGKVRVAKLLLDHDADANFKAKNAITPLHVAARWGQCEAIVLLVSHGADLWARTADGLTPVHCAARNGHQLAVDCLLELCGGKAGSAVAMTAARTKSGLTALHMAAQGDFSDCCRLLIHHGAAVDDVSVDQLTALHIAAHYGHYATAKLLLDRRCDPDVRAVNGFTPLHIACKKHRVKVVELLVKYGASIEAVTASGLSPLHIASFVGAVDVVQSLLLHGVTTMQLQTLRGETPLLLAVKAEQAGVLRALLKNGADVNAEVKDQQTALHIAARQGSEELAQVLLQHGASPDATTTDGLAPLHLAAKEGHRQMAALLIDHGATVDLPTQKGMTPLHIAAKYDRPAVARLLLEHGADINSSCKNGLSPLHVATHYGSSEMEVLLLDNGASPHVTAQNGYTPLHISARTGQVLLASALLDHGAQPSSASKSGFYPMHMAAREGHVDMTRLLFERGASVNSPANNGITPLHLCAQEDKIDVASALLHYGGNVNARTAVGYTPLHTACHFGHVDMVRFLIAQGAIIDEPTTLGYTPLHQAAQQGHILVVEALLQHQASPDAKTTAGLTALDIARRLGHVSVELLLRPVTGAAGYLADVSSENYELESPEKMEDVVYSDEENEGNESLSPDPYNYLLRSDNLFGSSAYGSSMQDGSHQLSASFYGMNGTFSFDDRTPTNGSGATTVTSKPLAAKADHKDEVVSDSASHAVASSEPLAPLSPASDRSEVSRTTGEPDPPAESVIVRDTAQLSATQVCSREETTVSVTNPPDDVGSAAGPQEPDMACRRSKASHLQSVESLALDGQPTEGRMVVLDSCARLLRRDATEDSCGGVLTVPAGCWLASAAAGLKGKAVDQAGRPVLDPAGKAVVLHDVATEVVATPTLTAVCDARGKPVCVPRGCSLAAYGVHKYVRSRNDGRPVLDKTGRLVVVPRDCQLMAIDLARDIEGTAHKSPSSMPVACTVDAVADLRDEKTQGRDEAFEPRPAVVGRSGSLGDAAERIAAAQVERPLLVMLPDGSLAIERGIHLRFAKGARIVQPSKDGRLHDAAGKKLTAIDGKSLKVGRKSSQGDDSIAVVILPGHDIAKDSSGTSLLLLPAGSTLVTVDDRSGHIVKENGSAVLNVDGAPVTFVPEKQALVFDASGMPVQDSSGASVIVPLDSDLAQPGLKELVLRPDGQWARDHEGTSLSLDAGSALLPARRDGTVQLLPLGGRVRSKDGKVVKVDQTRLLAVGPDDKPYLDWLGQPLTLPLGSALVPADKPYVVVRHGQVLADRRGRAMCFDVPVNLVTPSRLAEMPATSSSVPALADIGMLSSSSPTEAVHDDSDILVVVSSSTGQPLLDPYGRRVTVTSSDQVALCGQNGLSLVEPLDIRRSLTSRGLWSSGTPTLAQRSTDTGLTGNSALASTVNPGSADATSGRRWDSIEDVLCPLSLPTLTMLPSERQAALTQQSSISLAADATDNCSPAWKNCTTDSSSVVVSGQQSTDSFLISFMVDARGGIMKGYRREGMRFIVPPRCVDCPTRINCRLLRQSKLTAFGVKSPNLPEGQQLATRVVQLSPADHSFLSPMMVEIPHCAALRGGEREICALRSSDGQLWVEQVLDSKDDVARERRLSRSIHGTEPVEQLSLRRISRLLLHDLPHCLALISRLRTDSRAVGSEGGSISSSVVPQVRVTVPAGSVNKETLVSVKVLPITANLVKRYAPASSIGVGPVVTIGPFLRRFRQPLVVSLPLPSQGRNSIITAATSSAGTSSQVMQPGKTKEQTLHILCSASEEGDSVSWDDITSSTAIKVENDGVSFATALSARFWVLASCPDVEQDIQRQADDLYRRIAPVPFMARFTIFARRHEQGTVGLRVLCVTDDRLGRETLETQENYQEVARSVEVEVLEGMAIYVSLVGNLRLLSHGDQQPSLRFSAFHENRMSLWAELQQVRPADTSAGFEDSWVSSTPKDNYDGDAPDGTIIFLAEPAATASNQQTPLCSLSMRVPAYIPAAKSGALYKKGHRIPGVQSHSLDDQSQLPDPTNGNIVPIVVERRLPALPSQSASLSKQAAYEWLASELSHFLSCPAQETDEGILVQNPCQTASSKSDLIAPALEEVIVPSIRPEARLTVDLSVLDTYNRKPAAVSAPIEDSARGRPPKELPPLSTQRLTSGPVQSDVVDSRGVSDEPGKGDEWIEEQLLQPENAASTAAAAIMNDLVQLPLDAKGVPAVGPSRVAEGNVNSSMLSADRSSANAIVNEGATSPALHAATVASDKSGDILDSQETTEGSQPALATQDDALAAVLVNNNRADVGVCNAILAEGFYSISDCLPPMQLPQHIDSIEQDGQSTRIDEGLTGPAAAEVGGGESRNDTVYCQGAAIVTEADLATEVQGSKVSSVSAIGPGQPHAVCHTLQATEQQDVELEARQSSTAIAGSWEHVGLSSSDDGFVAEGSAEEEEVTVNEWEENECEGYIAADGTVVYTKIVKKQVYEDVRLTPSTRSRHPSSPAALSKTPEAGVSLQFGFDTASEDASASAAIAAVPSPSWLPPQSPGASEIDYEEVRPDGSLVHRHVTVTVTLAPGEGKQDSSAGAWTSLQQLPSHVPGSDGSSYGNSSDASHTGTQRNSHVSSEFSVHGVSGREIEADLHRTTAASSSSDSLGVGECDHEYVERNEKEPVGFRRSSEAGEGIWPSDAPREITHDLTEELGIVGSSSGGRCTACLEWTGARYVPSLHFYRQLSAVEELSETSSLDRFDGADTHSRPRQSLTRASTMEEASDDALAAPEASLPSGFDRAAEWRLADAWHDDALSAQAWQCRHCGSGVWSSAAGAAGDWDSGERDATPGRDRLTTTDAVREARAAEARSSAGAAGSQSLPLDRREGSPVPVDADGAQGALSSSLREFERLEAAMEEQPDDH